MKEIKRKKPERETRIIALMNQKGGVGKSTTAVNLAAALGEKKYKVLVIDFDPQGNCTSGLGIDKNSLEESIYDVVINNIDINKIICNTKQKTVFMAPSTIQLAGAEVELVTALAREMRLKEALESVKDEYDYIFIDCPPSLGILTINALVACDSVLIPIQCEYYALEGVTKLLESMKLVKNHLNPIIDVFGVVLTMYDPRTSLSKQVVEEVRDYFGEKVFNTLIPRNVRVSEAPSYGMSVIEYDPESKGAQAYMELAKEVNKRA